MLDAPVLGFAAPLFPVYFHSLGVPNEVHGLQYIYLHAYVSQIISSTQNSFQLHAHVSNYLLTQHLYLDV